MSFHLVYVPVTKYDRQSILVKSVSTSFLSSLRRIFQKQTKIKALKKFDVTNIIIPRAGLLTSHFLLPNINCSTSITANTGESKVENKGIISEKQLEKKSELIVLSDMFIVTGKTINSILTELKSYYKRKITVIVFVCGVTQLIFYKDHVLKNVEEVNLIIVYSITTLVSKITEDGEAKTVLGGYKTDSSGRIIEYQIGDYGDFYSDALKKSMIKHQMEKNSSA